ncbi:MAG: 4-hydroxyphenylpyruvate dioxygenase [Chromatiales bacterium]|nr:4-hydroxyphenylpyruvate dioxygenase [Chromatiales bacterium]
MEWSENNPMGVDGFEFVEYAAEESRALARLFERMGFVAIGRHRSKDVMLYRQGDINFIVNHEADSFARGFARVHGPSVCAIGLRVKNAADAFDRAVALGAEPYLGQPGPMELNIPAIHGVGRSLIYLIDHYAHDSIYDVDFIPIEGAPFHPAGAGMTGIDHLTNNVQAGHMDHWAEFYERIFNFREIRYFDIHGKATGLRSRAMVSPCGKVRIPINEPADKKSQIQEYLDIYHGEGVQHIALSSRDIYATVEAIREAGVEFMDVPYTYYQAVNERIPWHREDLQRLQRNRILIDGAVEESGGLLLQIFTQTVIGPIFFEIIQRKGHDGFGEGNFQALFEAIERDQLKRGVI